VQLSIHHINNVSTSAVLLTMAVKVVKTNRAQLSQLDRKLQN